MSQRGYDGFGVNLLPDVVFVLAMSYMLVMYHKELLVALFGSM